MTPLEYPPRMTAEVVRRPFVRHRETPHAHAVDLLGSLGTLVAPRDVITRARGQDFDLGVARQPLGDVPRVQFGPAIDVRAVALDDHRDPHLLVRVGLGAVVRRSTAVVRTIGSRLVVPPGAPTLTRACLSAIARAGLIASVGGPAIARARPLASVR
jgi:hypothetical protein